MPEACSVIRDTIEFLRAELRDLKRCQLQYFMISITATGAILSFAIALDTPAMRGPAAFAPLAILIPSWLIFFDKAATITRIAGYQAVLEEICVGQGDDVSLFLGWESALQRFREEQDAGNLSVDTNAYKPGIVPILLLRARHRFWMLNWYTFCSLSLISVIAGYSMLTNGSVHISIPPMQSSLDLSVHDIGAIALGIVFLAMFYTFQELLSLVRGRQSFSSNTAAWKKLRVIMSRRQEA